MKKVFDASIRSLCLCLVLCLSLTALLPLTVSADSAWSDEEINAIAQTRWRMNDDGSVTDGTSTLMPYELPLGVSLNCDGYLQYDLSTRYEGDYFTGPKNRAGALWPASEYSWIRPDRMFVTEEMRAGISALAEGNAARLRMSADGFDYAPADDLVAQLQTMEKTVTVNVTELHAVLKAEVYGFDPSDCFSRIAGAFYVSDDEGLLYVDYLSLDNTHFDADGNFSYRSGTVTAVRLTEAQETSFRQTLEKDVEFRTNRLYFQSDRGTDDYDTEGGVTVFWIFYVFFGLLLPVAPLVVGIVLANTGMNKKRWYAMTAAAGVWLLAAVVGMIVLLA